MTTDAQYDKLLRELAPRLDPVFHKAVNVASRGGSKGQQYNGLLAVIKEATTLLAPYVPCKKGCGHCCAMAVTVTEYEAKRIAAHIGKAYEPQKDALAEMTAQIKACGRDADVDEVAREWQKQEVTRWTRVPCVFRDEDMSCSIYPVRPIACRTYHTVAPTNEPCQLGMAGVRLKEVPMVDLQVFHLAQVIISGAEEAFADIRMWFPDGWGKGRR
jgi:uncharacterized protein